MSTPQTSKIKFSLPHSHMFHCDGRVREERLKLYHRVFGLKDWEIKKAGSKEKVVIICSPLQFARFIIERNNSQELFGQNLISALEAEIVDDLDSEVLVFCVDRRSFRD